MGAALGKDETMKDGPLSIRQPTPPFCWQSKIALNHIRANVPDGMMPNILLVYFTLTEMASDGHAAEDFRAKHSDLSKRSGLSRRTVLSHLQRLKSIGAISTRRNFGEDGRQLPSSILIHPPEQIGKRPPPVQPLHTPCAIAHGGDCTPILNKKKEEEESPLPPRGGESCFPSLEEVRGYAAAEAIPADTAARFHAMNAAGGWRDKAGHPIRNWRKALIRFAKVDGTAKAGSVASRPGSGGIPARKLTQARSTRKPKADFPRPNYPEHF
jgi:biotin operon repressor